MFAKTIQDYQRVTPLDKVCTKLVVKIKTRYCPEKQSAISSVANEVNLVDDDIGYGNGGQKNEGNNNEFDLTWCS